MRIKEISIIRYGPLPRRDRILLGNFNLFWGKNEEGKTLTIDALVKLLLGRNIKDFEKIDRVEEEPEGYVIIEDDKGNEIKLPEKGNLTKVTGLTPSECHNIFIVRNSNLSIARDVASENDFYTSVTDRLTGLRTREISRIKEILREIGKITPKGDFRDVKDEKLKTRVESAKNLINKIKDLEKKIEEKGFDELEEKSVILREEIERITQEIKSLEDARKREKYEKGKEALDNLKKSLEGFKDLEVYNEKEEQLWRQCENEIKTYSGEKAMLLQELGKKQQEFEKISEELSKAEIDFQVFEVKKRTIDTEIQPKLMNYKEEAGKVKSEETKNKFYRAATIASVALLSISILGVIINPLPIFYELIVFFLVSTVIFAGLKFSFIQKRAKLGAISKEIELICSKLDLDVENVEKVFSKIQKFEEEYKKKSEELGKIKGKKEILEREIQKLQTEKIPEKDKKIQDAQREINKIKEKSGEESLEEYAKKHQWKQKLEKQIGEQESVLKSLFGEKSKKREENILFWEKEVEKLEEYKDKAKSVKYSETTAEELDKKKREFEEKLNKKTQEMSSLQEEMKEVERTVNEILQLEGEYLYCKTSVDLKAIKDKLQEFIHENESLKDNALEVIKIFEEIEREEKEKVSQLFGRESPVSKYFKEITEGLYEEVTFDRESGKIKVKRKDGKELEAEKLSGGAYDQLYFSIRLALGEKLLTDKKGFFILDDPFIKADPDRLKKQIEMLKKISESGWQVIYFSAKGEIKEALEEEIKRGAIKYVEVKGIFS